MSMYDSDKPQSNDPLRKSKDDKKKRYSGNDDEFFAELQRLTAPINYANESKHAGKHKNDEVVRSWGCFTFYILMQFPSFLSMFVFPSSSRYSLYGNSIPDADSPEMLALTGFAITYFISLQALWMWKAWGYQGLKILTVVGIVAAVLFGHYLGAVIAGINFVILYMNIEPRKHLLE